MTSQGFIPAGAVATALGRHALALVAQDVRANGIHRIAIPNYHCLTMELPFALEGFRIERVPVGIDLLASPSALATLADPSHLAFLHCEVFGAAPSPQLRAALGTLMGDGAAVIVDGTHRWPLPPRVQGNYYVASIRKFTGLSDGAYAAGGRIGKRGGPRVMPRAQIDAAEQVAWDTGEMDYAEELMDQELVPVAMSGTAREALQRIDVLSLVAHRRANAEILHAALRQAGINPISSDAHFAVAFHHGAAQRLIVNLARAGIDGPVWWPRPSGWQGQWPDDVVTLPTADEPDRVIAALRDAAANES